MHSDNVEEHQKHVQLVFQLLKDHKLFVNKKKCEFGKSEVAYLGHVISSKGVSVDVTKIQAMLDWPVPRTIKDLRGFLGLTGYYRKFIAGFAKLAPPLTEQLKKDHFCWTEAATEAFNKLKTTMVEAPILALPDFEKLFTVERMLRAIE